MEETNYGMMTWAEVPFIVLDLETTGFSREDRIVEFGAVLMKGNRPADKKHHIVNPGMPIPEASANVHGLHDEDVVNAPRWRDVAKECFDFLFSGPPIVGHNISFDMRMLAQQVNVRAWPRNIYTLCTLEVARSMGHKGKGGAKLAALAEHYNLEYGKEHTAIDDSVVTGMLARRLCGHRPVSQLYTKTTAEWADQYAAR